jgi:hypothetical protein
MANPAMANPMNPEMTNNRVILVVLKTPPHAGQRNLYGFQTFQANA